jgi:hypothetical protein
MNLKKAIGNQMDGWEMDMIESTTMECMKFLSDWEVARSVCAFILEVSDSRSPTRVYLRIHKT